MSHHMQVEKQVGMRADRVLRRPVRLLARCGGMMGSILAQWNWKSAVMSCAIRSTMYLIAASRGTLRSGIEAALVETAYVAATAGFWAAIQQAGLRVQPQWRSNAIILLGVPLGAQLTDFFVHYAAGTVNLKAATIGTTLFSLFSAAFHLHLMRHGAMLVGEESRSFASDLRRLPRLIVLFFAAPVAWFRRADERAVGETAVSETAAG